MFNFLGSLASLVGLVFSALAFVFAKRASTAAREARDAAMRQSLVESVNSAARLASDVATYLRADKLEMALLRVEDLMNQTRYLIGKARLPKKSRDSLSHANEQLRSMHQLLGAGVPLSPQEKARLRDFSQQVSGALSEEHGIAAKAAESWD